MDSQGLLPQILETAQSYEWDLSYEQIMCIYNDCYESSAKAHPQASRKVKSLFAELWTYDTIFLNEELLTSISALSNAYAKLRAELKAAPNTEHREQRDADAETINDQQAEIEEGLEEIWKKDLEIEAQGAEIVSLTRDNEHLQRMVEFWKGQALGNGPGLPASENLGMEGGRKRSREE